MAFLVAIQTPYVQTRLSKVALNQLAAIMDGRIQYDELKVMTSGVVVLRNVKLIDRMPYFEDEYRRGWFPADTVFSAKIITATFSLNGLFNREGIHLGRVTIEDGAFHLVSEPGVEYHDNLSRIFRLKPSDEPPTRNSLFNIKKLRIQNFRFRMNSFLPDNGTYKGHGLNFDDLDLTADIVGHGFRMADAKIIGYIDRLEAREKSGYFIDQFSASCEFGLLDGALIEDLRLRDPWSDLNLRTLSLQYNALSDFSDFVNKVVIEADIQRSRAALQSIAGITGDFQDSPLVMDIRRANVSGSVSDLRVERLSFTEHTTGVSTTVEARITGLPELQESQLDATLQDLTGTTTGLSRFLGGLTPESPAPDFGMIAHNVPLTIQAQASGPFNDLDINVLLQSPEGEFSLTGDVRNAVDPARPISLALNLATRELDLGSVLGMDILGPATLQTRVQATLASGGGLPDASVDSLHIDRIHALGHDFHDIRVTGTLNGGVAEGHIQSLDPLLRLNLTGLADLAPAGGRARYRLDGIISNADLAALGFDAGGRLSRIATSVHADLVRSGERFDGSAQLDGLRLIDGSGTHPVGDIRLQARTEGDWQDIRLAAPFLDARFRGDRPVTKFIPDLQEITLRRDLPALFTDEYSPAGSGQYSVEATFHDTRDLLALFLPGAYIEDGTGLTLSVSDDGLLDGRISSGRIAFDRNYLRNVEFRLDNGRDALFANIVTSELRAGNLVMVNPTIDAGADDDRLSLGVHYDNFSGTGGDATLNLEGLLFRDEAGTLGVRVHPVNSHITTGGDIWTFDESDITLLGRDLRLDRFQISNGAQHLLLDGGFSPVRNDTLSLVMDRFDLALVDELMSGNLGLEGKMNGLATVTSGPDKALGMLMDFSLDTLKLSGADAGTMRLTSRWYDEGKELGIQLRDVIDGRDAFQMNGSYFIQGKHLNLRAVLDAFPLDLARGFLPDIITDIGGGISGSLSLTGPTDNLRPSSQDLHLDDAFACLGLTGVTYTVSGPVRVDENGCYLEGVSIRDRDDGVMNVNAALRYHQFKDFRVEGQVDFDHLTILDAEEKQDVPFYGLLRASGTASARGSLSALAVDADVTTSGDGNVHLVLSGSASASLSSQETKLLTFTDAPQELDPYEEMLASLNKKKADPADISIRGRVNILPAVRVFAEIDKAAGNVASFNGQGTVGITLRPVRDLFELNGDYNINEGTYQFVLPNVLSKTFTVQRGSSVKFAGDIPNTDLDIIATYGLRTSLDPILAVDNLSRRQVNCVINVTDRLRAPNLILSIDVPDLDPSTRMAVEAALSTSDKVQKQFVSLLLLGSFLPDETSGVFSQSNPLFSNVMEMMSGQISNALQRLKIPVDVGFGYQEMLSGQNLFDISLSTELFENRVLLAGNFGRRKYSTGSTSGDFTGDLDLQVKLDPEGKFRFNVFSHSADEFTNFLDFSQRNGIGVSFQQEYTSFHDFVQSLFVPRKKREGRQYLEAERNTEQVIIHINDESRETVPHTDSAR